MVEEQTHECHQSQCADDMVVVAATWQSSYHDGVVPSANDQNKAVWFLVDVLL